MVRLFDPAATLRVIEQQRVNSFAVPTMLDAMARDAAFATAGLSALRSVAAAGAPLPLPVLRAWQDRGITVQQAYGMTEASPGFRAGFRRRCAQGRLGGQAVFFTDLRVIRPDGETRHRARSVK